MTDNEVYTAMPMEESPSSNSSNNKDDLVTPLLSTEELCEDGSDTTTITSSGDEHSHQVHFIRVVGVLIGLITQVVSLVAYGHLLVTFPSTSASQEQQLTLMKWCKYWTLQLASRADLIMYAWIWVAVVMTLSNCGVRYILACLYPQLDTADNDDNALRRLAHMLGVNYFVGTVFGNLLAWIQLDWFLGFPIPLAPISCVAGFDVVLCFFLVWSFRVLHYRDATISQTAGGPTNVSIV